MQNSYASLVQAEIDRLSTLGWNDLPSDQTGVRQLQAVDESEISFPAGAYDAEQGNRESSGVWAMHRATKIADYLRQNGQSLMWEIGAGDGNVAYPLRDLGLAVITVEPLRAGAETTARAGFHSYCQTLAQLKFPDNSIEAIGIFDVLEHLPNPQVVLDEIYRVLKPGGVLITTVPANQWLFSDFDTSIGHFLRYSQQGLEQRLNAAGFKNHKIEFLFFVFVLPALILRRLPYILGRRRDFNKVFTSTKSHTWVLKVLDPIVKAILKLESRVNIPTGLSLVSVSIK
jgi:SAM-dependent methyltransferase